MAYGRPSAASVPLIDVQMYRPGPYFALVILLLPPAIALVAAAITLNTSNSIPVWLPFLLLLWIPALPAVWLLVQSVRTTSRTLATGRPWRTWHEVSWTEIDRAEQRGFTIYLHSVDGRSVSFVPLLLQGGAHLERQLFLRLPSHVFTGRLARKAQSIFPGDAIAMPEDGLSGSFSARPQRRWFALLILTVVIAAACIVLALQRLPLAEAIPAFVICGVIILLALTLAIWLAQTIDVSEEGVEVSWSFPRRSSRIRWRDVQMVEHSSGQALIRLRGVHRLVCIGPTLMNPSQCMLFRAFLHEYCSGRGIPIVRRPWLV